jgi:hypothetical protein
MYCMKVLAWARPSVALWPLRRDVDSSHGQGMVEEVAHKTSLVLRMTYELYNPRSGGYTEGRGAITTGPFRGGGKNGARMMGCGKHEEGREGTGRNKRKRREARRGNAG